MMEVMENSSKQQRAIWRVLVTRSRAEKQVSSQLEKLGVVHYLPLRKELRMWHDRKKWVELPLFNGYLFVHIAAAEQNRVFDAIGAVRYLWENGKPAGLTEAEIDRIKRICNYEDEVAIIYNSCETGDWAEVQEGPFKGYKGILIEKKGRLYLQFAIKGITCSALLHIHAAKVSRINIP
ncbi:hypothetical protein A8C56_06185 [Niabella ginsenosidivorans]|uniref:NusG-like N-terminal domain-containing protein n=1 Tax=Niabella ginsenosidivorans TaxID=1176587 RepID=A0A1A9I225_9BACT|nr:UpxY family transcription antiterminator [Niabella ginsenosidivorans]ANH80624.1 hypothetical protein A8C56_06185 [Niabella ginsenosidivorans]